MAGRWIWTEDWNNEDNRTTRLVLFRTKFEYAVNDSFNGYIRITADTRYKLYVNGQHVQSGPAKGDDKIRFVDKADLSGYLCKGTNVIAISVLKYSEKHPYHSNHSLFTTEMPGLYIEGFDPADYGAEWKSHVVRTIRYAGEEWEFAPLHIHERTATDPAARGWKSAGFDDSVWDEVRIYGGDDIPEILSPKALASRRIPYMRKKPVNMSACTDPAWNALINDGAPVTVPAGEDFTVVIDAGEEMTAYPYIKMHGGAGTSLEILYSECYVIPSDNGAVKANRLDSENGYLEGYTDTYYITEEGDWAYEPYWFRTFRFIRIRIRTGSCPLTINSITFEETGYPLEARSYVRTSDDSLAKIWDISLRTLRRCMHETYIDCPFYEQLQYIMDTRSQILYTYAISADDRLARQAIDDFRRSQREDGLLNASYPNKNTNVIPGFSMFYILAVYDHMMYFGDPDLVRENMPAIDKALSFFDSHIEENGLVGSIGGITRIDPVWAYVDWTDEWRATEGVPPMGLTGPDTPENLIYVMGLQAAAELADYIGETDKAAGYRYRAEVQKSVIRELCMNENGILRDGPFSEEVSQHSQILGVLTDLFSKEEGEHAMYACMTEPGFVKCSVAWGYYLFRALEKTGLYYMTDRCWDIWRRMLANGSSTCVEGEAFSRSECHAWGALALYELPSVTLGVRPAAPGYEKICVKPVPGYLDHAEGIVHTPHGDISVAWKKDDDGRICTEVECADELRSRIVS